MHRSLQAPQQLHEAAQRVDAALSCGELCAPMGGRSVQVGGEAFVFPYRAYYSRFQIGSLTQRLTGDDAVLAVCLVSRHHDGRVREAAIRDPQFLERPWTIPFAVQLLGEYVVEVGQAVEDRISSFGLEPFVAFARENQQFMETTRQRAVTYWDCYYRDVYRNLEEYPCFRAINAISTASQRRLTTRSS